MRPCAIMMAAAVAILLSGCERTKSYEPREVNTRVVESIHDMAIQNAIIRQQTLYPYHFVTGGAALNDLGAKELRVLAQHYLEHPGTLNVRQAGAAEVLRQARVQAVLEALEAAGVEPGRVTIADGMPGGEGISSDHVFMIIEGRTRPSRPLYYSSGGGQSGAAAAGGAVRGR